MTRHLDEAALLEVLYLNDVTEERAEHLAGCVSCHDRFATLRSEIDQDRSAHDGRIASKPEQFWQNQRDEIVARATFRRRGTFAFLRFRPAISIVMAVLFVAVGFVAMRAASRDGISPGASSPITEAREESSDLFGEEDLRALDPWESDELGPFHRIVEWEEWIDSDLENNVTVREES